MLNDNFVVALNFISSVPNWMLKVGAKPMYLGLDLRGGLHFLMQIDMASAYKKKMDSYANDIKQLLQKHKIRNGGVKVVDKQMNIDFQSQAMTLEAMNLIKKQFPTLNQVNINNEPSLSIVLGAKELLDTQVSVISQNMQTLNNRINALGVAEPVIQQSGQDRIMIQLPGTQDTAQAKNIIGRTASLEVHLVANDTLQQQVANDPTHIPSGYELVSYPQAARTLSLIHI